MQKIKIYILKIEKKYINIKLESYNTIWTDRNLEHKRTHKVVVID